SPVAQRPVIEVNCAAIPPELIESELFGHEKGAFTGATARKRGLFELADGGTIFLDEIGDMSLSAQAKVLRVLQSGELNRVGSEQTLKVDVRVVAATNRDLQAAVAASQFREDLYFRLAVVPLRAPPLRDRADAPRLAQVDLPAEARALPLRDFRDHMEREYIRAKLDENGWNISKTAQLLGIERTNLHKKLRALGLTREDRR